jgi:hypothetical protein
LIEDTNVQCPTRSASAANTSRTQSSQLLEHAPYCERDLHGPTEPLFTEGTEVEVLVKHRSPRGGSGFVVCNFVPRKVDYHPLSIPVPYYHSNVRTPPTPGPGPAAVAAPPSFPRVGDFARASRGFRQGESGILSG